MNKLFQAARLPASDLRCCSRCCLKLLAWWQGNTGDANIIHNKQANKLRCGVVLAEGLGNA
jgi:hypothetical protein